MSELAFLFPGQGSQRVGMGRDLCDCYPPIRRDYFAAADDLLGYSISAVCFDGPDETLSRTEFTQPALLVTNVAFWAALREEGVLPGIVAGHSLGEFAACVAAGALSFADALLLVALRGRLMAQAGRVVPGGMTAIVGLEPDRVRDLCEEARSRGQIDVANYNAPTETVVAGELPGLVHLEKLAECEGADIVARLRVSAPFHSRFMEPAVGAFREQIQRTVIHEPSIPIIANVTGASVSAASEIRELLCRQIAAPVLWHASMLNAAALGYTRFVQVGPGKVLSGLVRRILPEAEVVAVGSVDRVRELGSGWSMLRSPSDSSRARGAHLERS